MKVNGAADTNGHVDPGVSIRFGPVQKDEDVEMNDVNGASASKRKARSSANQAQSYAEPESSEEDEPLVRPPTTQITTAFLPSLFASTADSPGRASVDALR